MNTADKFPAVFYWINADKMRELGERMAAPGYQVTPDDVAFVVAIGGNMMDSRYKFAQSLPDPATPPILPPVTPPVYPPATVSGVSPPLKLGETRNVSDGQPGILFTMMVEADGRVSVEVSGSPPVTIWAGKFAGDRGDRVGWSAGTSPLLAIAAGEWVSWMYDAPQAGQNMRPQLLAP